MKNIVASSFFRNNKTTVHNIKKKGSNNFVDKTNYVKAVLLE